MSGLGTRPGLPRPSRPTDTECQRNGARMPVPIAFEKASLAAKRLARWLAFCRVRA